MATRTAGDGPATGERTRLSLLGPVDLKAPDGSRILSVLSQPRRVALLAYIAVEGRKGPVSRDLLLALFWSDREDRRARKALRDALHFLRRSLGSHLILTPGDEVSLDWDYFSCDTEEFLKRLEAGDGESVRTLYRGEFMKGFHVSRARQFEEWAEQRRRDFARQAAPLGPNIGEGDGSGAVVLVQRAPRDHREARSGRRRLVPWALAALLGVAGLTLAYLGTGPGPSESAGSPSVERDRPAIAVLPFENRSLDRENASFADGVHGAVLAELFKVGGLIVISGSEMARFKEVDVRLRDIGDEYKVDAVLQGSAQRTEDRVWVDAQLIEVASNATLWAGVFDRRVEEVFAVQSEIALRVAEALRATLTPEEEVRLAAMPISAVRAQDFYYQGRRAFGGFTPEENQEAGRLYRRALEIEPEYALAWAGLSRVHVQAVTRYGQARSLLDSAETAAARALAVEPELASVHLAVGEIHFARNRFDDADRAWLRAYKLEPNLPGVTHNLSVTNRLRGRLVESLRWLKRAFRTEPNYSQVRSSLALNYLTLGMANKAQEWIDSELALFPDRRGRYVTASRVKLAAGDPEAALAWAQAGVERWPEDPDLVASAAAVALFTRDWELAERYSAEASRLGGGRTSFHMPAKLVWAEALERLGRNQEAAPLLREVLDSTATMEPSAPQTILLQAAATYAAVGQSETAVEWLRLAYEAGWRGATEYDLNPVFDEIRDDERVQELLSTLRAEVERMRFIVEAEEQATLQGR